MLTREILKKVRRIEIMTNRLVNEAVAGQYHSVFKGRGMEFDEVREYQPGDDVRKIDWNVTARTGVAHVKRFVEERELTVMLVVDASASTLFGTQDKLKSEVATEFCALLAFAAIKNNDRVGLALFTHEVEMFIPPKKGRRHVLRVIRELVGFSPRGRGTDIPAALEHLNRVLKRKTVVFLVSDFLDHGLEKPLSVANRRHDLIAAMVQDPRERELPNAGLIELEDAETGEIALVDTGSAAVRRAYAARSAEGAARRERMFRRLRIDAIPIATDQDYVAPMMTLFRKRAKRQ